MFSMISFRAICVCAAGLAATIVAPAQNASKIGVINLQRALVETAEIKKAQVDLEAKFRPRTAELEKLQKEMADIQNQLQSGRVTPQAEQELTARGQRRQREAQRIQEDLQGDVDRERQDILQRAGQRMTEVVRQIADARALDVVVDVTNAVFFRPAIDITNEAIAAYDKAHPATAAAAPAAK
jgi:outer membrane protein